MLNDLISDRVPVGIDGRKQNMDCDVLTRDERSRGRFAKVLVFVSYGSKVQTSTYQDDPLHPRSKHVRV